LRAPADFLPKARLFLTFSHIREEEPGMDNRVRDLDQIQEDDGDDRGRRLGTILLATAAVVGLTFAIGVVVGRAAEPEPQASEDPLARLSAKAPAQAVKPAAALPKVEAADLSFPNTLSGHEERPEVLAALRAAAEEEAALAEPAPVAAAQPAQAAAVPVAVAAAADDEEGADEDEDVLAAEPPPAPAPVAQEEIVASIPAAVAAGSGARSLPKAALHDPLVAAAIREPEPRQNAPRGHDGEFTLQVISYDRPEPSQAFAEGLRAKGHTAFVTAADIPERGRYWRVRIGPFKSRQQADEYRSKFEDEEHMNTFVVRVKPED
jgi:cell division septation protein DedD